MRGPQSASTCGEPRADLLPRPPTKDRATAEGWVAARRSRRPSGKVLSDVSCEQAGSVFRSGASEGWVPRFTSFRAETQSVDCLCYLAAPSALAV